jgi:hypothetical protein
MCFETTRKRATLDLAALVALRPFFEYNHHQVAMAMPIINSASLSRQEAAAKRKAEKGDVDGETEGKPKKKAKTKKAAASAPAFVLPEPRPSKPINRKKDELARAIEEDVENKYAPSIPLPTISDAVIAQV